MSWYREFGYTDAGMYYEAVCDNCGREATPVGYPPGYYDEGASHLCQKCRDDWTEQLQKYMDGRERLFSFGSD